MPFTSTALIRCEWCQKPLLRHRKDDLERCRNAYRNEVERRKAGPARVGDVATLKKSP